MDWIESQLDDETIFPQKLGTFEILIKPVLSRIFLTVIFDYMHCSNVLLDCCIAAGAPFPPNFRDVVKTIFKRLFRVYAHIYHSHFQKIVSLKEEAHLNTCFKHFVLFTWVSGYNYKEMKFNDSFVSSFFGFVLGWLLFRGLTSEEGEVGVVIMDYVNPNVKCINGKHAFGFNMTVAIFLISF